MNYVEKYTAFLIDELIQKNFSTYAVGVEIPSSVNSLQIETIVIVGDKRTVVETEVLHAKLV